MSPTVTAALVSGVVALIGAVTSAMVSIHVARKGAAAQADLKSKELIAQAGLKSKELIAQADLKSEELITQADLKSKELIAQAELKLKELRAQLEATRQTQLTEIVKKRIETYPAFYEILARYGQETSYDDQMRIQNSHFQHTNHFSWLLCKPCRMS